MTVAIIGSQGLSVDISKYIPEETTQIVTGGHTVIGRYAEAWADAHGVPKLVIKSEYMRHFCCVPRRSYALLTNAADHMMRIWNRLIIDAAERVVAIWDGKSDEIEQAVAYAKRLGMKVDLWEV